MCTSTLTENSGDVYTVKFHPGEVKINLIKKILIIYNKYT